MAAEDIVVQALTEARERGIRIMQGPVFDWRDPVNPYQRGTLPSACNAFGAVLLHKGLEHLVCDGFQPGWLAELGKLLGEDRPWLWRFTHGWDYANQLSFTVEEKGKERTDSDKVSRSANKLALQWVES